MDERNSDPVATEVAAEAQTYKNRLAAELVSRGLEVTESVLTLNVKNLDVGGSGADGMAMSPGLGQEIRLRERPGSGLWWWWVWPAERPAQRGVPHPQPELEPICPADQVQLAADRVRNVVRLRSDDEFQEPHPNSDRRSSTAASAEDGADVR